MKQFKTSTLKNEDGVSLIEVVASIVLLTIILISFMSFFPQMGLKNNQNENKQLAINVAQQELEYWKTTLENSGDFKIFKENPSSSYSFIGSSDTVLNDVDTITIQSINTKSTTSDFNVEITLNKHSDLNSLPTKAYQIHIKLFKNNNIFVSETYGYIFYEG